MDTLPNQVYTVFSFIGFVLCAIPFYWHLEAWNVGTCLFMAWTGLGCLIQCINSIVWNKNMIDKAPVYCDIVVRIQIGLNVAISACSLCINRRLYKIASAKSVITDTEKRRQIMIDLMIGLGIPVLHMISAYIVTGHRYNLFEDFGPFPAIVNRLPSYFLVYAWPLVIGCVSFIYCARTIYHFYDRGRQFQQIMTFTNGVNRSRYFRLMALSSVDMIASVPLATYVIVHNAKLGLTPWISWSDTHSNFSRVIQVPAFVWKNDPAHIDSLEMFRWVLVACAFVIFAFFGFAEEARKHYRLVYTSVASRIGISNSSSTLFGTSQSMLQFKRGVTVSVTSHKRDSMVSSTHQFSVFPNYLVDQVQPDPKVKHHSSSDSIRPSYVQSVELGSEDQLPRPDPMTLASDLSSSTYSV
ncbi:STE3-domain-containing protein [Russula earlei]|uniref:STE3-domain-containing protein n=1 Tax=Russula earlei TaxID=71964 RepID=A0ACC0UDV8_9AGAM|nr:STE3-domain-containing protein [Russula earlei]